MLGTGFGRTPIGTASPRRPQYGVHDLRSASWSEGDRLNQAADLVLVGTGSIDQATDGVKISGGSTHSHILFRRLRWSRIYRPTVEIVARVGVAYSARPMVGLGSLEVADINDGEVCNRSVLQNHYWAAAGGSYLWGHKGIVAMGATLSMTAGSWARWCYSRGHIDVYELPSGDPSDWWDTSSRVLNFDLPDDPMAHYSTQFVCPAASSPVAAIRITEATP